MPNGIKSGRCSRQNSKSDRARGHNTGSVDPYANWSVGHRFEWRSVTGARNRLLCTWRRSRLGLSWPFTRRRGAGMTQRRNRPDGGRRQSDGRPRGYATACRARSNSCLQESRVCPNGWGAQDVLQRLHLEHHLFIGQESRQLRRRRLGALLKPRGGCRECRITVLSAFALCEPLSARRWRNGRPIGCVRWRSEWQQGGWRV